MRQSVGRQLMGEVAHERREGQAHAREGLGERHHVGVDVPAVEAEEALAGAAAAGLDVVDDIDGDHHELLPLGKSQLAPIVGKFREALQAVVSPMGRRTCD